MQFIESACGTRINVLAYRGNTNSKLRVQGHITLVYIKPSKGLVASLDLDENTVVADFIDIYRSVIEDAMRRSHLYASLATLVALANAIRIHGSQSAEVLNANKAVMESSCAAAPQHYSWRLELPNTVVLRTR